MDDKLPKSLFCLVIVLSSITCIHAKPRASDLPHIIFIIADDLGWADVNWEDPNLHSPNLYNLATNGIVLNNSYVQPLCSPSRSALMSGYFPFHTGLQHMIIGSMQPAFLPENVTTLPQGLKDVGYATHAIGKWHLGFCNWKYTPTFRGFDSFYGYYNADEDYYRHEHQGFLDFRLNEGVEMNDTGVYSTFAFSRRAQDILETHNTSQPLFLYLAFQAVHFPLETKTDFCGGEKDPLEMQDVASLYPDLLASLKTRLEEWKATLVPANFPPDEPLADPENYGGWADVNWEDPNLHSPNLYHLAHNGIILGNSYVQPVCSPTSSFVRCSQLFYLPQALQQVGYVTHAIGKWHLGFCNWKYTPRFRGFDSFYGYYNAGEDYYNHVTHAEIDNYIVNGYVVNPINSFPWQLSLQRDGSHICGAVVYNNNFALTAAHCVAGVAASRFQVMCGAHNIHTSESWRQTVGVIVVIVVRVIPDNSTLMHPSYSPSTSGFPNDIAVLALSPSLTLDRYCQPPNLPSPSDYAGQSAVITGWGRLYGGGTEPSRLKRGDVEVLSNTKCRTYFGNTISAAYHICVKDLGDRIYGGCNVHAFYEETFCSHITDANRRTYCEGALDFRFNEDVEDKAIGVYSTFAFSRRAQDILEAHNTSQPLFLYLAFQAVHSPLEVPDFYEETFCSHITDTNRRTYCGMLAAMDEAIGNITQVLERRGYTDNMLLVFTTDNGGDPTQGASNWPLRGAKNTLWEGGTRAKDLCTAQTCLKRQELFTTGNIPRVVCCAGAFITRAPMLMHIVDWFPTFMTLVGGETPPGIDGVSQWESILSGGASPRTELVYNIDEINQNAAIRVGDWKLIQGSPGNQSGWYPPPHLADFVMESKDFLAWPDNYSLFNINEDPLEMDNVASKYPDVLAALKTRLEEWKTTLVPANFPPDDPLADPQNYGVSGVLGGAEYIYPIYPHAHD
ncbi:arylsulfatase B-like [Pomacea canaliculata]|uniref:arylsulfatase B-like n=1 Tax=Pomacea canaliculata TaxID=400727 RepID=UPI000D7394C9|nr:arylsulfatase B-like [Pomacea canaliculata]